jgi:hypothetical protein
VKKSHKGLFQVDKDRFLQALPGQSVEVQLQILEDAMRDRTAIALKDYEQRRERQAQGIEKAKAAGKY